MTLGQKHSALLEGIIPRIKLGHKEKKISKVRKCYGSKDILALLGPPTMGSARAGSGYVQTPLSPCYRSTAQADVCHQSPLPSLCEFVIDLCLHFTLFFMFPRRILSTSENGKTQGIVRVHKSKGIWWEYESDKLFGKQLSGIVLTSSLVTLLLRIQKKYKPRMWADVQ